jgi:hypothetical protein
MHLFVFRSRRGDGLKLLYWDSDGYIIVWRSKEVPDMVAGCSPGSGCVALIRREVPMRRLRLWGAASLLLVATTAVEAQPSHHREGDLKEGAAAPDFTVKDVDGRKAVKLSELRGKPVVLIFGSCT